MTIGRNDKSGDHAFPPSKGIPLQVARWTGRRAAVTTSATSQRLELPDGASLVEIVTQEAVYINFGDSSVVASDVIGNDSNLLFLTGVQIVPVPLNGAGAPQTHVAVLAETQPGVFQVSELG